MADQESAENSEIIKRQRRWNSEGVKVSEQQSTNHSPSTTPKDAFQTSAKRPFSRSESTLSQESPKERVVPPSTKTPTTSLRIDHFVRPFTLKAVQELLGKTGKVVSFWMDQIKTHCYVTYESVEEATETRNAVCNLQWPVYGGKLLMADFVDPQEVKNRVDPPPPTPVTIPPTTPVTTQAPQPSPRLKQQQLPPPPSLPPPPPLATLPAPARNRATVPEKIEPPIVTLDDLFRKTRATPRIYYLPLSDEQVAAKMNAEGKSVK
ncbi:calponin homology domain-containing protein [Tanacetum coccineum]|uniref:Calponin homology domain-containing protein n=1 Tax=Tanacetum coccineum TaxID=301880 RepID=A0ABQ4ZK00_9ASTR